MEIKLIVIVIFLWAFIGSILTSVMWSIKDSIEGDKLPVSDYVKGIIEGLFLGPVAYCIVFVELQRVKLRKIRNIDNEGTKIFTDTVDGPDGEMWREGCEAEAEAAEAAKKKKEETS